MDQIPDSSLLVNVSIPFVVGLKRALICRLY